MTSPKSSTKLSHWQIKSSKIVHSTPWIEVIEDTCQAGEKELIYTYTRRVDEGPVIIPKDADGKLWMVRQYRHAIQKIVWQFPQEGKLAGEDWAQAAARGLQEELGLEAEQLSDLGEFFPDPGGLNQKYHLFVAEDLHPISQPEKADHTEEVEELEVAAFTRKEIDELIAQGKICDNWTLAALFLLERYENRINHSQLQ